MTEKDIFEHLLKVASESADPRGVAAACLVVDGVVTLSAASSDDGVRHAEEILLTRAKDVPSGSVLYTTLLPCAARSRGRDLPDCTSLIIEKGIQKVVFGAVSPEQEEATRAKLTAAGAVLQQVRDPAIVCACATVFNNTVAEGEEGVILKPFN